MRRLAILILALLPGLAHAQPDISAEIAASGLAATEARLAALPAPSDAERFALGGVRFLSAVERALQARYRHAFSPALVMQLPVLRLPIPENPAPEPVTPELLGQIFEGVLDDMAGAQAALAGIPESSDFGLEVRLADLWFDIDGNGARDPRESLFAVAGPMLFGGGRFEPGAVPAIAIRFDVADSRWLDAYAGLVSGIAHVVLAYDPAPAIAEVMAAEAKIGEINTGLPFPNALDMTFGRFADTLVVIDRALRQQPDAAHGTAARTALLGMVAKNRDFWRLVAAETDNAAEWVPNDRQDSGLGLRMPEGTGPAWLAVLADAEGMLEGRLLIPYWRLGEGAGLNLKRMFEEPRPVDLVAWVQGIGALPYAERGTRVSAQSWRQFERLMEGRAMLFAVLLN